MDKEKGECLVFCGRKKPYIAKLPDIDIYDNGEPLALEMSVRKKCQTTKMQYQFFTKQVLNSQQK